MINKNHRTGGAAVLFSGVTLLLCGHALADRIILKEGKEIQGKISFEDADEYVIDAGKHMVLHVDKSKVRTVIHEEEVDDKAKSKNHTAARPVSMKSPAPAVTPAASPVKAGPTPVPAVAPSKNPKEAGDTTKTHVDAVELIETRVQKFYPVKAANAIGAFDAIFDLEKGLGPMNGQRRDVSQVKIEASWTGKSEKKGTGFRWKSAVVSSTITTLSPRWDAPPKADSKSLEEWNVFVASMNVHDAGRADICRDAMRSFGESISRALADSDAQLRDETGKSLQDILDRADKRQQGFDRRSRVVPTAGQ